ncbi:TetR/AcrR family transcriptional regulator [Saccharopolyspora rhizosphaerae]|uniref:TetR/AcrR family transcriptional regulator n=1 Tax=Saccharopolyspora rhizosphaerae TaxID=2492662 RepID=A0A426JUK1_9PSEU|nr:TetR/AcrR family transcriptional regulator [Saccharopolyspora rhizosphaerae]RRO16889.1 TetR/AcrR family transcriptional regulator [Saccharopolyspora rhizosphaerae]
MRAHGWAGNPPANPSEARSRILTATRERLAEAGTTNTAEVAERVGVTRQTVYRYFPTTEELLNAAANHAVSELVSQLVEHVRSHLADTGGDAGDAAVEAVAFAFENLRDDPALNRLLTPGRMSGTVAGLTSDASIHLGRELITDFGIDWAALGWDEDKQSELVEHLLRTLQSLVLDPGDPPRSGTELRAYLQRWLAPALR